MIGSACCCFDNVRNCTRFPETIQPPVYQPASLKDLPGRARSSPVCGPCHGFSLCFGKFRKQAEINVHGLERARIRAAGNVSQKGAERGGGGRQVCSLSQNFRRRKAARQKADCRAFDIAFHARYLAGKAQMGLRPQPELGIQQARRVDEGIGDASPPSRANCAFSSPGMVRKMRTCSACFSLV